MKNFIKTGKRAGVVVQEVFDEESPIRVEIHPAADVVVRSPQALTPV